MWTTRVGSGHHAHEHHHADPCSPHEKSLDAPVVALRAYYTDIATDEARHAALAFETVLWLVTTFPALEGVLNEETDRLGAASPSDRAIVLPLVATVLGSRCAARPQLVEDVA